MACDIEGLRLPRKRPKTEYGRRDNFCLDVQGGLHGEAKFCLRFES